MLGTNDAKDYNWALSGEGGMEFKQDVGTMLNVLLMRTPKPVIFVMEPPRVLHSAHHITETRLREEVLPAISEVVQQLQGEAAALGMTGCVPGAVNTITLADVLGLESHYQSDGLHPSALGQELLAEEILARLNATCPELFAHAAEAHAAAEAVPDWDASLVDEFGPVADGFTNITLNVATVGSTTTRGLGIPYSSYLQDRLQQDSFVGNYGAMSAVARSTHPSAYLATAQFASVIEDIDDEGGVVMLMLGTYDSHSTVWAGMESDGFRTEIMTLANVFLSLPSRPAVWLLTPPALVEDTYGLSKSLVENDIPEAIKSAYDQLQVGFDHEHAIVRVTPLLIHTFMFSIFFSLGHAPNAVTGRGRSMRAGRHAFCESHVRAASRPSRWSLCRRRAPHRQGPGVAGRDPSRANCHPLPRAL